MNSSINLTNIDLINKTRCPWAIKPLDILYHDHEWGKPVYEDNKFFEFLILEGAQAGLSWSTILQRREGYREAFAQFDPEKVAKFSPRQIEKLIQNPRIIRHRLKILSAVNNAKAFLKLQAEYASFSNYIWQFVEGQPVINTWKTSQEVPAFSPVSDKLSRALRQAGFSFVGTTICYALIQATGLVNDHLVSCFCRASDIMIK